MSPEKLYLQTDREVYCVGDTIWFKGYLTNASKLAEYRECNYIYVELLSSLIEETGFTNEFAEISKVRSRVKVKRTDGGFQGYIKIGDELNSGVATLRAYSYWMLNWDPELMFYKTLELRNPIKDDFFNHLVKGKVTDQSFYRDMGMNNPFRKELLKKKTRETGKVDVQFLPESGRYVAGVESVIGIKAVNEEGLGIKVHGDIYADGVKVADFVTNEMGMGRTVMIVPAGSKELTSTLYTEIEEFQYDAALPLPEERAVIINVRPDTVRVVADVIGFGVDLPDSAFIVVHDASEIFVKLPFAGGSRHLEIAYPDLHPGINNVSVVDSNGNVYAQRCFFAYPQAEVTSAVSFDRQSYGKREKVRARIKLKDNEGLPVDGDFSLSVTDDYWAPVSGNFHNIVSYLLLGSELNGMVEKPQRYFCDSMPLQRRVEGLDLLMMTQGWNYYDLPKILKGKTEMPHFGKEYEQSLSGWVHGIIGKAKKSTVYFLAPSINFSLIGDLDSSAYFSLNGLDFPDSTMFLIGAQGTRRLKNMYCPIMNPEYFAVNHDYGNYFKFSEYGDDYKDFALQSYYSEGGELMYTLSPSRIVATQTGLSPYPNDNFKASQYRNENQLRMYSSSTLGDYLAENVPGIRRTELGIKCKRQFSSLNEHGIIEFVTPVIYCNGMLVESDMLDTPVSEILAVAWASGAQASKYLTNLEDVFNPPTVVFIKTRFPVHAPYNVVAEKPLGWQKPKKFYSPKYESANSRTDFEPMRATIHWEPSVRFNGGIAEIEFYTSDSDAGYSLTLEGLAPDGTPVSCSTTMTK